MKFKTFQEFVESLVIPLVSSKPEYVRLDGRGKGGNRAIFGIFDHEGKSWKVHSDSSIEPLMLAYDGIANSKVNPFREEVTKLGTSLVLTEEIQQGKAKPRFKHLYIYKI